MSDSCYAQSFATGFLVRDNGSRVRVSGFPAELSLMTANDIHLKNSRPVPLSALSLLIKKSQEGDTEAMARIYELYKRPLFNLAYRFTQDRSDAEDLLQDIFVKVFTHIKEVNRDETFVAWMYRIALNTCFSHLRSRRGRAAPTLSLSEIEGKNEEAVTDGHEKSLAGHLDEAVRRLPERLRAVFLLHDAQGHTHEEIGQILGFTVGTSKSQLFKARMRIREYLKEKKVL